MRISDRGAGSYGGYGNRRERADTFRRRYRIGERVKGRLIQYAASGLAHIDFEGLDLLARIETTPQPHPGQTVIFIVKALSPEILLQEIGVTGGGTDLPLASAIQHFWAARAEFEAKAEAIRRELASIAHTDERNVHFKSLLTQSEDISVLYRRALASLGCVNEALMNTPWRADYRPTLIPEALGGEILFDTGFASEKAGECMFSFQLPSTGQNEIRLYLAPPRATCRILMERPQDTPVMQAAARVLLPSELSYTSLSPTLLPAANRSGVLARFLAAQSGGTGLHLRV